MADVSSVNSSTHSSVSGSSARSTPVPQTYKPITQSASVSALTKLDDEELRQKGLDELLRIFRRLETENRSLVSEHGSIMKDVNRKMQILLLEIRSVKDINQTLQDDNQELRDLCCFLDDDRQRGRKLAREWQRFGRYTASVMRSEVSAYQEKLKDLEMKQEELISDNTELKELCLFLDQERLRFSQTRDEGDGSSNSTIAGNEENAATADGIELLPLSQLQQQESEATIERSEDYMRQLEDQIRQLEEEKRRVSQFVGPNRDGPDGSQPKDNTQATSPNKPEAVVHAMKVLEVHEQLERPLTAVGEENLDDKEKAIVREMCNVVWRKLGNVASDGASESSTPHPVYENVPSPQEEPPTPTPGSRSNTSYHYQPSSAATSYQPEPPQQPGQKTVSSSHSYGDVNSQSYRQPGNKVSSHASQQPSYGYVRTSRSAPVTPVPPQHSQIPDQQPTNVGRSAMPPDRGRQYYDEASRPHTHTEKQIASNAPPDRKAYNMVDNARYGPPQKNKPHSRSEFEAAKSDSASSKFTSQPVYQNHPLPGTAQQPLPSSAQQPLPSSAHPPSYANIPRRESSQKQHPNYYNVSSDAPPVREYRYTPTSSVSDSVSSGYSYQPSQPRAEHLYSNSSVQQPHGHSSQHFGHSSQLPGHSSQPSVHSSQRSTLSSQSQYPPHPSSQHPPSSQSQSQFTAPAQQASQKPAYQHLHQSQYNQNPYQYSQRDPSPNPSYRSNKQPHQPPHYSSTPTKDRGNFQPQSQPQQYSHSKGNSEGFSYSGAPDDYPDRRSSYLEAQDARAPQQYINPHDVRSRHDLDQYRGNNYYK